MLCSMLTLSSCVPAPTGIADLERYPQNAHAYYMPENARQTLLNHNEQIDLAKAYTARFFRPWHQKCPSLPQKKAFWGVATYEKKQGYRENLQPWTLPQWEKLVANQHMAAYPSMGKKAITLRNTSLRVLPTNKPFFFAPSKAGEGFPFDYFQNSALWVGTPLLVTHQSADGAWFFAEAGYAYGWIAARDLAWITPKDIALYETGNYAVVTRDALSLYDVTTRVLASSQKAKDSSPNNRFLATAHIGAILPIVAEQEKTLLLALPVETPTGYTTPRMVEASRHDVARFPLPLTPEHIASIANQMIGQPYGWGGLLHNRDCSAAMRDLFTVFGVWLPRNSTQQARKGGTLVQFTTQSPHEKRAAILANAVPFYTLIWFKGHIGLYLGPDPETGSPMLLHNAWGARSRWYGTEGRAIVGKFSITTLQFATERPDVRRNWFYKRMKGYTILPQNAPAE